MKYKFLDFHYWRIILKNISFLINIILLAGIFMLMASNSAKDVIIKNNQDKYGINIVSELAIAAQRSIISQCYDEFIPLTQVLTKNDSSIIEVSVFDLDGKYLANENRDNSKKIGQTAQTELKTLLDNVFDTTKIESTDKKYTDYIAPIKLGTSMFGTVLIRFENISSK